MINYLSAIIFGIVQGATEFLPVSSSGHLVILHKLFPNFVVNDLAFDAILHLATLVALIWYFRREVINLIMAWLKSFRGERNNEGKVAWLIILGIMPALMIGYLFSNKIETYFHSIIWTAIMLVVVGILFIIFEKFYGRSQGAIENLTWRKVLAIGVAQTLSLIPGTSRSGITIIAGLASGLKREAAVKFSFLMSMPLIAAAGLSQLGSLAHLNLNQNDMVIYAVSFLTAIISGYLAIKYFLRWAVNYPLNVFAYYRFILAAIIILYFFF
jgi:undecaprenyl-diphosphatase